MPATIMIVDDSKTVRTLVRGALETDAHRIVEAADGCEALALIDGTDPDLVITDVNMPAMDGLALIRELHQRPRFQLMPILVLTTEGSERMMQKGRELGATGWVVKPFDPGELRQAACCALELRAKALSKLGRDPS